MAAQDASRDTAVGLGVLLSLVAGVGALVMYRNPADPIAGWGFALAMLAAGLAVAAVQAY